MINLLMVKIFIGPLQIGGRLNLERNNSLICITRSKKVVMQIKLEEWPLIALYKVQNQYSD